MSEFTRVAVTPPQRTREEWMDYWAKIGARLRLVELEAERQSILATFPELQKAATTPAS